MINEHNPTVLYQQALEALKQNSGESVSLSELLERVKAAHNALSLSRPKEEIATTVVEDADAKLWEAAAGKLRPSQVDSPELKNWFGATILQVAQTISKELQSIAHLDISNDEKSAMYPVPIFTGNTDEVKDISSAPQTENDPSFMKLTLTQLQSNKGRVVACGGIRGGIIAAGSIDVKLLFFNTEFALYKLRNGNYPTGEALTMCQKRAANRLESLEKYKSDDDNLFGVQLVLAANGHIDWMPIVRAK